MCLLAFWGRYPQGLRQTQKEAQGWTFDPSETHLTTDILKMVNRSIRSILYQGLKRSAQRELYKQRKVWGSASRVSLIRPNMLHVF